MKKSGRCFKCGEEEYKAENHQQGKSKLSGSDRNVLNSFNYKTKLKFKDLASSFTSLQLILMANNGYKIKVTYLSRQSSANQFPLGRDIIKDDSIQVRFIKNRVFIERLNNFIFNINIRKKHDINSEELDFKDIDVDLQNVIKNLFEKYLRD